MHHRPTIISNLAVVLILFALVACTPRTSQEASSTASLITYGDYTWPATSVIVRATAVRRERVLPAGSRHGCLWHSLRINKVLRGKLADTLVLAWSDDDTGVSVSHGRLSVPRAGETLDLVLQPIDTLPPCGPALYARHAATQHYSIRSIAWK